jgi:uncharacterized membrane protein YoaK (UPF0700 family)
VDPTRNFILNRAATADNPLAMTTASSPDTRRLFIALLFLTFVTGVVDAASVLGLGRVFTANMTGNVVFLGFSLARFRGVAIDPPAVFLLALGAFLVGAAVTARLVRKLPTFRRALAVEIVLLVAANAVLWLAGADGAARLALLAVVAAAMGAQTACVRRLAVADMTTTVLTLTLAGLAADSALAGGQSPRVARRVGSVIVMLAGAITGAALLENGLRMPLGAAAVFVALAAICAPGAPTPIDSWTTTLGYAAARNGQALEHDTPATTGRSSR